MMHLLGAESLPVGPIRIIYPNIKDSGLGGNYKGCLRFRTPKPVSPKVSTYIHTHGSRLASPFG